jgi:hypothetical protein
MILMTEFYTKYVKVKNPDGTVTTPKLSDCDKWILEEIEAGKTICIVKGRVNKIILV